MVANQNKLYDFLRDWALEYAYAKQEYDLWEMLSRFDYNKEVIDKYEKAKVTFEDISRKYEGLKDLCEFQKDEHNELFEIEHEKDKDVTLNIIKDWMVDLGYDKDFLGFFGNDI